MRGSLRAAFLFIVGNHYKTFHDYLFQKGPHVQKNYFLIIITAFWTISIANARINQTQLQKIDSLIASWNIPNAPGGAIGIMERGKILFTKRFGLASLDYDIPNTENTLFNIGSVSKQMTAMGIVKLHIDGRLSIDDDIRKYVPEVPDFGHQITIRHLLHHTSGLRDFHSLRSRLLVSLFAR